MDGGLRNLGRTADGARQAAGRVAFLWRAGGGHPGWRLAAFLTSAILVAGLILHAAVSEDSAAPILAPYQLPVDVQSVLDLAADAVRSMSMPEYAFAQTVDTTTFITEWSPPHSDRDLTIPVGGAAGTYTVDWGDGSTPESFTGDATHSYNSTGTYNVTISGDFERIHLNGTRDAFHLRYIHQWGDISWTTMEQAFSGASNMEYNAKDAPDLSGVTSMTQMFSDAYAFNGDISSWDVSKVTDMSGMFSGARAFNQNISSWDVSKVTDMSGMFRNAHAFNQNISSWDVLKVTDMSETFNSALAFNQDISSWDVSKVTDMSFMLTTSAFNQNISSWDVSKVTDMSDMFSFIPAFNGDISSWDVSSVTDMSYMFPSAAAFNGNISSWDVSSVTDMNTMFSSARVFNGNISSWDVSSVTDMSYMFPSAAAFNGNISSWDVSSVTDMNHMFYIASAFNQNISTWDVSSVTDMSGMFRDAAAFNGDISPWDVSSVTDMGTMFASAAAFNGDISLWDVSSVTDMRFMFASAAAFNGDISLWDVPSVTDMGYMFYKASAFNQNISTWDVSSVENMDSMFYDAAAFAQNLGKWYVIPADTAYDTGEGTLNVTTISAQNAILDGQEPDYGIGTGGDSDLFNMTGSALMSKSTPPSADTYEVNVTAPGGDFGTGNHRILEITVTGIANTPPVLEMIGDRSVNELEALSFTAIATDVDHLAFGLTSAPQGASITAGGAFSWTPTELQDGNHTFTVTVRDSAGATDSETITVTVREVNVPPVLNSIGSRSVNELVTLAFTATVTDPDNNEQHTFSLARAPLGASITAGGAFSWTPTEPQDGTHTVTISVQDRFGATDSETITVTVREVNVPPALVTIGDRSVDELETLSFTATVTDPDNNEQHTFSLARAPLGASITAGGAFSWTPTEPQDGTHTVTISVQDRFGATDSETITVTVREVNVPPALVTIGDRSVDELETLSFTATVTDPDNNEQHTFSLARPPPLGASITAGGAFSWTPTEPQDGTHTVTISVQDRFGATDSETITVTVREVNVPPALVTIGDRSVDELETLSFTATVTDPDNNDVHTFSLVGAPTGAAITQDGTFSWTPTELQDGNHTFTVTVRDSAGATDSETITVTVNEVDHIRPMPLVGTGERNPTGSHRIRVLGRLWRADPRRLVCSRRHLCLVWPGHSPLKL